MDNFHRIKNEIDEINNVLKLQFDENKTQNLDEKLDDCEKQLLVC